MTHTQFILWRVQSHCCDQYLHPDRRPQPSFVDWITSSLQWKVPTLRPGFGTINHTALLLFELLSNKQQVTCPCGQNNWVSCQALTFSCCLRRPCWDCMTMSRCSSQGVLRVHKLANVPCGLGHFWWTLWHEDISQYVVFLRMCAPSQRLTENCSFFCVRSRPKRSSVLETSSSLQEMRNITESPLCHYFIPPIQTAVGVIHARTWRNTLSFKKKLRKIDSLENQNTSLAPSLSVSLFVSSFLNAHSGLETKLINNQAE